MWYKVFLENSVVHCSKKFLFAYNLKAQYGIPKRKTAVGPYPEAVQSSPHLHSLLL
jgi:hypothetical protein